MHVQLAQRAAAVAQEYQHGGLAAHHLAQGQPRFKGRVHRSVRQRVARLHTGGAGLCGRAHGPHHRIHRPVHRGAGACQVHADVARAVVHKFVLKLHLQAFAHQPQGQLLPRQACAAHIHPCQIGGLGNGEFHPGQLFLQAPGKMAEIFVQIVVQFVHPIAALAVSRLAGLDGQGVGLPQHLRGLPLLLEGRVCEENIGQLVARQVKGLGGGGAGDDALLAREQACEHSVLHPRPDEVKMDLVAHHKHVVGKADLADAHKLLFAPYPAGGVMGVAQKVQGHRGVLCLLFKISPIHLIPAVFTHKAAVHRGAAIFFDGVVKGVVGRGIQQNAVGRPGEHAHGHLQRRHHARAEQAQGGVCLPAVPVRHPSGQRRKILRVQDHAVAQDAPVKPGFHGVQHGLGAGKIHIRDPHGNKALRQSGIHHFAHAVLDAVRTLAVDEFIKIVHASTFHSLLIV